MLRNRFDASEPLLVHALSAPAHGMQSEDAGQDFAKLDFAKPEFARPGFAKQDFAKSGINVRDL
jgi:hypothetical protein